MVGPGVVVERGAAVSDSIILHDAIVEARATVARSIVDELARVEGDARVGAVDGDITVVGGGGRVARGAAIGPGERVPRAERTRFESRRAGST